MEILKNVNLDYKDGKIVVEVALAAVVLPAVDAVKAKVEAGEIDLIPGTDLDKEVLLQAIDFVKKELAK